MKKARFIFKATTIIGHFEASAGRHAGLLNWRSWDAQRTVFTSGGPSLQYEHPLMAEMNGHGRTKTGGLENFSRTKAWQNDLLNQGVGKKALRPSRQARDWP